jgi:alkanesulfonate monooxygenase SsuD/methylene tetrahydromethanopterin reductase-like flavin-dependent oxidoreductase (luciferase family)
MDIRGRPLHVGVQLPGHRANWAEYEETVRTVDGLGLDSIWNFDHLLPPSGPEDASCLETLTTLSAMALITNRARIGVLVTGVLYRDPATLAKACAQVDQMSGGRLEFSLGAAWAEREFHAYGLDFPPLAERYARLGEAIQIIKSLWSQERTTFEGRYYRILDAPCAPKPLQAPLPPITVGGAGLGALRIAARHANRLNLIGSPERCAEVLTRLARCCEEVGRNVDEIELSVHPGFAIAPTTEQAEALVRRMDAEQGRTTPSDPTGWIFGSPAQATATLRRYFDVGVSHFVLACNHPVDPAPLRLLEEEVLPALR